MTKEFFKCDRCGKEWDVANKDCPRRNRILVQLIRGRRFDRKQCEPPRECQSGGCEEYDNIDRRLDVEICEDCYKELDFHGQFKRMTERLERSDQCLGIGRRKR